MKKRIFSWFVPFFVMAALTLAGCGEVGDSDGSPPANGGGDDTGVIQIPTDVVQGTIRTQVIPNRLVDLGDLVGSTVNTWWYTKANAINDGGFIVGQSNQGDVVKGAFIWNPNSNEMTFLGIHGGVYDDFFLLKNNNTSEKFFVYSEAVSINASGAVVGNSTTGTGWPNEQEKRAFLYKNEQTVDLPPPAYQDQDGNWKVENFSEAVQINNKGEIIITADGREGRQAYYWDSIATVTRPLQLEGGGTRDEVFPVYKRLGRILGQDGEAVAINEMGQAVINSGGTAVFHDLNDDAIEVLNFFPGVSETRAVDLNNFGHVVGVSGNEGFFWRGGSMYPMGHLGGGTSEAVDINNNDQVAGNSTRADGTTHAIIWTLINGRGRLIDLGTLGGRNSFATAINDAGQVVGYSETGQTYSEGGVAFNVIHGFLWTNGVMYDLGVHNDFYTYPFGPSFPMSRAVAINENGQIAGNSNSINEHYRGFYLNPTLP